MSDLIADIGGIALGHSVLFIAVTVGNDLRKLTIRLTEKISIVWKIRFVAISLVGG